MTLQELLTELARVQSALITALDANDIAAINQHTQDLDVVNTLLRGQGALRTDPVARAQLDALIKNNTAAAQRLRFLRDQNEQRLAAMTGSDDRAVYAAPSMRQALAS